jgi:hypothetical protein
MTERKETIPAGIKGAAAAWYRDCVRQYRLVTAGELGTLAEAARCLTRISECQAAIKQDGLFIAGARGTVAHPALRAEQQARGLFLQAVRQLGISAPCTEGGE